MSPNRSDRHLDTGTALDFLEGRLPAGRSREAEEHLGGPCPDCRERILDLGLLLERMRRDRTPEVPAWLRERALAAFGPGARAAGEPGLVESVARLVFDSWDAPLPAATRRAVGDARRLRFALGENALEMEVEVEAAGLLTVRGRVEAPEPLVFAIEITAEGERFIAMPDAEGGFLLERVPSGVLNVVVGSGGARYRLPAIAP